MKERSNEATNGGSTPRCSPKLTRDVTTGVKFLSRNFCKSLKGKRLGSKGLILEGGGGDPAAAGERGDQVTQESQVREWHLGHLVFRNKSGALSITLSFVTLRALTDSTELIA